MESTNLPEKKYPERNLKGKHRPTEYLGEETDQRVYELCLLGLNNDELASRLLITHTTFKRWVRIHDSFRSAVYAGKDIADGKAALGLFKAATGYTLTQEKAFVDKDGCEHVIKITEEVGPNSGAALNWLKNRQPNLWSDKQQIEHSGEMSVTMDLNGGDAGSGEVINIDHEEIEEETDDE